MKKDSYIEVPVGNSVNTFGMQQRAKRALRNEYTMDGEEWTTQPTGRPQGRRLVFNNNQDLQRAQDVYDVWNLADGKRVYDPVLPETIYSRLTLARNSGKPVTLFVPWGLRPEGKIKQIELQALDELAKLKDALGKKKIATKVMIMPADIYATEVNNLDSEQARIYFSYIAKEAKRRGLIVDYWSDIRNRNLRLYQKYASELTEQVIDSIIDSQGTMDKLFAAGRRRSNSDSPRNSTYAYLRERIAEAKIIEEIYSPIKVSLAPKNKDNIVDCNLPRLYIMPESLQLPWLK